MELPIIKLDQISKVFSIKQKTHGFLNNILSFIRPDYLHVNAVDNISFEVEKGEFLALIGPNGAGKSTTIKIMTGILTPTNGLINVHGYVPYNTNSDK